MKKALLGGLVVLVLIGIFVAVSCTPTSPVQKDCVVMLGDSIFALSGDETVALEDLSGQRWRQYYKNGAQLQGGSIIAAGDIEDQLDSAIRAGSIRTIVMDGGGNDFLLGSGSTASTEAELKTGWGRILTKAQNAGVKTIVFQGYYKTTSAGADQLAVNDRIVAWLPAQGTAHGIKILTYNPNTDAWFTSKRPASYTKIDGIHPTTEASDHLASQIWNLMVSNNIEQTTSCSGSSSSSSSSSGGCN